MSDNQQLQVQRQRLPVEDSEALFDTARFEHMARIAGMMARATMLPDHLRVMRTENGALVTRDTPNNVPTFLDVEATTANAFLIVNQARLFGGIDPFALAQSTFFVHGRLGFEGKLVQAVLERRIGPMLFENFGEPGTQDFGIKVTAWVPQSDPPRSESVTGTVADWQTKKNGAPLDQWKGAAGQRRMLHYRGTREWARMWAPGLALGLLDEDDLAAVREDFRANKAIPVDRAVSGPSAPARPFNPLHEGDEPEEAEVIAEPEKPTPAAVKPAPAAPEPKQLADEKPPENEPSDGGKRAPRGTPQRFERMLMVIGALMTPEQIDAYRGKELKTFLDEMTAAGVKITTYQQKAEDALLDRKMKLQREQQPSGAGYDAATGEIAQGGDQNAESQGRDWNALIREFEGSAARVQTYDALDTLVEDLIPHELPASVDGEVDAIVDATRRRIAATLAAQERQTNDTFPGDLPMPNQDTPSVPAGDAPQEAPDLTAEEVSEIIQGWGTSLRKCKTVAELKAFNAETVTPFVSGRNASLIDGDELQEVKDTYRNRTNLLSRKEADAAKG